MEHSKLQHLAQIDLGLCEKMIQYCQEALPIRIESMHFINPPYFVAKAMALIKPFLKGELSNKVHVHEKLEDLDPFIPIKSLPADYGGQEKQIKELSGMRIRLQMLCESLILIFLQQIIITINFLNTMTFILKSLR